MGHTDVVGDVRFYGVNDEYGAFSNFAPYPVRIDGTRFRTSEHAFQAQKFRDPKDAAAVRDARTPAIAARIGRDRSRPLRKDWEAVKVGIMREIVLAKFSQHADLGALLLATGDARIVEHTENDDFWGDGGDGHGANMLGRILVKVRAELRRAR